MVEGNSNKMIARRLGNREETVKVQMKSLFRKLGLKNRTQAAVWAVTNGFGSERPDVVERAASPSGGATVVAYPPRANGDLCSQQLARIKGTNAGGAEGQDN